MRSPLYNEIRDTMEDRERRTKLSRKYNNTAELEQIYDQYDQKDEYDLDKMRRDFDRQGIDVGDWKAENQARPRFVELDELDEDTDFKKKEAMATK